MPRRPDYDGFVDWLRESFDDDLRWTASFDHETFDYDVHHVRQDLKTELTGHQLDTIIHRSIALFNRDRVDDVYFHLGDAEALVAQHERAVAVHLYLDAERAVVVMLEKGAEVTLPTFPAECLERLGVEADG
ncbi:hypothetical protein [Haloglomus litoreum]|uniref:hypothetical protein n=1 Tax=Haloglomus litoreum TaxID=3034026 RepID=UPI0023E83496|nr:hypothetical protein [Haloglomus sp. DT116]